MGPLRPGLLNHNVYKDESAIDESLALTLTFETLAAALVYAWTQPHYRRDHELLHPQPEFGLRIARGCFDRLAR